MAKIHYSSYWGTFSRVLKEYNETSVFPHKGFVEIDLTPVNPNWDHSWDDIPKCHIRIHGTSRSRSDESFTVLPDAWFKLLGEKVGGDIRHFLLTGKILDTIDYDKYQSKCNGGANLRDIIKDGIEIPEFIR